jgi:hypothetical protein
LAPHVKEFYLGFIRDDYPELLARYLRAYPGTHAPPDYRDKLAERIERIRRQYGFGGHNERHADALAQLRRLGPQLALPI